MARIARVVAPGIPHHITQRGNRRQETFFCAEDYQAYIGLMREWRGKTTRSSWWRRCGRWGAIGRTVSPRGPRRTRSRHFAAMNGAGGPGGVSHSSRRLRGSSAGRSGEESPAQSGAGRHK